MIKRQRSESDKRNKLKENKPLAYEKILKFEDKTKAGESIAIIQFQFDYTCNFRCQHCSIKRFQGHKGREQFTVEKVNDLADQADALGLARFVMTGGEPLVSPNFDSFVKALNPSRFYISCDTNGWFLDLHRAKHLKSIGVDRIQLSIDSLDPKGHDDFRRKKGAFDRTLKAVDATVEAGLDLFIQTVVTKERLYSEEFIEFIEYFNNKDIDVFVTYAKPVGSWEGNFSVLVDREDMDYLRGLETKYRVFTHLTPAYGIDIGCIAVKGMISVTQYGDVLPCPYMPISIGNVFTETLGDILERAMKWKWIHSDTCLVAEDLNFIKKYIVPTYSRSLPVPWTEIFKEEV